MPTHDAPDRFQKVTFVYESLLVATEAGNAATKAIRVMVDELAGRVDRVEDLGDPTAAEVAVIREPTATPAPT